MSFFGTFLGHTCVSQRLARRSTNSTQLFHPIGSNRLARLVLVVFLRFSRSVDRYRITSSESIFSYHQKYYRESMCNDGSYFYWSIEKKVLHQSNQRRQFSERRDSPLSETCLIMFIDDISFFLHMFKNKRKIRKINTRHIEHNEYSESMCIAVTFTVSK